MKKSFFLIVYWAWMTFTFFIIYSVKVPPTIHWTFAFFPLIVIPVLLLNGILLIVLCVRRNYLLIALELLILIIGFKFFTRTYSFHASGKEEGKVKLLTYNVKVFNSYQDLTKEGPDAGQIIHFALNHDADIKCFQEFYHYPGLQKFNLIQKFKIKTPYSYFDPSAIVRGQYFGLVIFSKYPIIKKGEVKFSHSTFNQAIFADIVIANDTLRVYNIHLQSMSIDEKRLPTSGSGKEKVSRFRELFRKIRNAAKDRTRQLDSLIAHMDSCPYKILVAGDLNDTPYSYTYERLKEKFDNDFELKGSGFGFTYNGKLFFLRIDNVFSDKRLNIKTFKTLNDVGYSDHFPLEITF